MDEDLIDFLSDLPDLTAKQAKLGMAGRKLDPQEKIAQKQRKQRQKLEALEQSIRNTENEAKSLLQNGNLANLQPRKFVIH